MAKILVTPVKSSGVAPYEVAGSTLTSKVFDGEKIYYIAGRSFPECIVTVLEADDSGAHNGDPDRKDRQNEQKEEKTA